MLPDDSGARATDGLVRAALIVLVVFAAAGAVVGVIWSQVAQPSTFTVDTGQAFMGEAEAGRQFGVTVSYAWLGAAAAVVLGFVLGLRLHRHGWATALLVAGAAFVAALVAWRLGLALGPVDPKSVIAGATDGDRVPQRLEIDSYGVLLVWPVVALAGLLAAITWFVPEPPADDLFDSSDASTETHGGEPRNH